ncbi:MAG TPA: PQQ-binding-like beta-propeller repeat protein [Acidobacteriota bacterium]|nr:PQQ-binding-like beta-propeller repeat protein [Acidobacteriota bacterium]
MRINRIQQVLSSLLLSSFLAFGQLGAQNGNGNGNAGSNNPNGNNRSGDKNQPDYARGFDISDSRISDRGRDRREIHQGKGHVHWPKDPTGMKLDWNYDVGGGGQVFDGPYPVNGAPAKWNFLYANQTSGDNTNDRVYVAVNSVAGQTQSDQFTSSTLNGTWYFRDQIGNSSYSLTANSGHLQMNIPSGSTHDCWGTGAASYWFNCATMLETSRNIDATYETKIDGTNLGAGSNGQSYGIMVWQDDANYLLIEYFTDTTGSVKIAFSKVINGTGTIVYSPNVSLTATNYIRVQRSGNIWTPTYSQNGSTWNSVGAAYTQALIVNRVGLEMSNYTNNPATTGNFDYFIVTGETPRYKVFSYHNEPSELGTQGGQTYRRLDEAAADVASGVTISGSISSTGATNQQVSLNTWVTSRGNPGAVTIPAGTVWSQWISAWDSKTNTNKLFLRLYKLSGNPPTLTQIVDSTQTSLLSASAAGYNVTFTFPSTVTLLSTDRLAMQFFAVKGGSTQTVFFSIEAGTGGYLTTSIPANNVYAFSDIYNTVGSPYQEPFCLWQKSIGNGVGKADGSSVTLSLDGSRIYLASTDGKVYCLNTTDGSTVWSYDTVNNTAILVNPSIRNSTPYYDYAYDQIWIGSEDGRLHKINGIDGTLIQKSTNAVSTLRTATAYAIHSTPVRYSFGGIDVVLVGTDDGFVYRVNPNNLNALVADSGSNTSYNLTSSGTTAAADAIWGTPIFDVDTNSMVVAVNGNSYKVNLATGAKSKSTLFASGSIMYSSPAIDWDNNFAYVGGGLKLWKTDYLSWPATTTFSTSTQGTNPDNTYPRSSPLWVSGATDYAYIGDGGGYMNRFTANNASASPSLSNYFQTLTQIAGDTSDSPPIMDYFTGNIYFGAKNGRLYQLSQTF